MRFSTIIPTAATFFAASVLAQEAGQTGVASALESLASYCDRPEQFRDILTPSFRLFPGFIAGKLSRQLGNSGSRKLQPITLIPNLEGLYAIFDFRALLCRTLSATCWAPHLWTSLRRSRIDYNRNHH